MTAVEPLPVAEECEPSVIYPLTLKLDLGCGKNKQPGFWGVDSIQFPGTDEVVDLTRRWPWASNSVSEVYCSHMLEHLDQWDRVHFANELYRVLKPARFENGQLLEGFAKIITPHWANERAFGDPTHKWPPVCGWSYFYWNKLWRMGQPDHPDPNLRNGNAPHTDASFVPTGFNCDFDWNIQGVWSPAIAMRSDDFKGDAAQFFLNAFLDTMVFLTVKK